MNPLLDFSGLPKYGAITPADVHPAVAQLIGEARAVVERLVADPATPTWDNFVEPLDAELEKLGRAWGQVGHLNAVMNSPALREAYNAELPVITEFWSGLGQNLGLFAKYRQIRSSADFGALNEARKTIIDDELRDFRLSGAELPDAQKARFKQIQEELAALSSRFSENLLDATDAFSLYVEDESQLSGLPDDVRAVAKAAAEADGKPGFKLTLHMPCYLPVMQYADHRPLREQLYRAYSTRASEFGKADWDNTPIIDRILALRQEEASLLGYASYADVSLATKMAETPADVLAFLHDLSARSRPFAQKDMQELRAFAEAELGMQDMQAWDVGYASEKLRVARYAFSDQEVKQYFPESVVLDGLFRLLNTLYGISVKPDSAPTWHPSAKFFRIEDPSGKLIGQFYLDLYARQAKRGGAWMDDAITRVRRDGKLQTPVAYLVCNFSAPVGDKPALFTHDDVITLFHEFGHGLHHLLSKVEERSVSGINGVEWDAVELPSQFMENFCWEWDVLSHMTRHVDTGAPLPRDLFDKMIAAKNFQSGLQFVRQLEFSLFDMRLHHDYQPGAGQTVMQILEEVRQEVSVLIPPAFNRFPMSFAHIFGGGYAAGYYSYKWAEVLSADVYAAFEEAGVLNPETGNRFWSEILAVGGSRPAMTSFTAFRGRAPSIEPLLRHNGMVAEPA